MKGWVLNAHDETFAGRVRLAQLASMKFGGGF